MSKRLPQPKIKDETLRRLFEAAAAFLEAGPWEYVADSQIVGWTDPASGEIRIASVLGNAKLIYAALFYRRAAGLHWVFRALQEDESENPSIAEGMDCLKLEFVSKRELSKEDLAAAAAAGLKPPGRGGLWPRFQSFEPGWQPWLINQEEADELLFGIWRLLDFCRLLRASPEIYAGRSAGDVPFLPPILPGRTPRPEDLDWRPFVLPPDPANQPVSLPPEEIDQIARLPQVDKNYEFNPTLMPGVSYLEGGRPALARLIMLVDHKRGTVLHVEFDKGPTPAAESVTRGLGKALLAAKVRPRRLLLANPRLQPLLQSLCDSLGIELKLVMRLPAFEAASKSLMEHLQVRKK